MGDRETAVSLVRSGTDVACDRDGSPTWTLEPWLELEQSVREDGPEPEVLIDALAREALPERYRVIAMLGAGLGLRQGEAFGLSPDDIDWLRGTVQVRRQVKLIGSHEVFGPLKYGLEREVPLPDSVKEWLAAYLASWPARPITLPWRDPERGKSTTVRLMATTRERMVIGRNYFNANIWKPALREAGVPVTRANGTHALRHFFASALLAGGESIRAVSEYLEHVDPGFTLRTYTHQCPAESDVVIL